MLSSLLILVTIPAFATKDSAEPLKEPIVQVARWLEGSAVTVPAGLAWPAVPAESQDPVNHLYSGSCGVVLFFLHAYRQLGDPRYAELAGRGAQALLKLSEDDPTYLDCSLYTGVAGIGLTLLEAERVLGEERYRTGVDRIAELLQRRAVTAEGGVEWNDITDVVSGSAGIGLFLLEVARAHHQDHLMRLAAQAGDRLLLRSVPEAGGRKWPMDSKFPRWMPNFSHGTAGVGYFLATLFIVTSESKYLQGALDAANYLQAAAVGDGMTCKVFHHEPDGEQLFYLGWCHGPPGTARLFYRLFQITGDPSWMEWVHLGAGAVLASDIPEQRPDGFWNNVGQCCGSAGVADFLWSLQQRCQERSYTDKARELTRDLLARATIDDAGMRWVHAEHRVRPELLQAQTGYMQGAAGIGLWLLRLHAAASGSNFTLRLPDNPFAGTPPLDPASPP
jgi:lantibiotic modifying enzyme